MQPLEIWRAVIDRDNGICQECGAPGAEVHHIISRRYDGAWRMKNMLVLCRECHQRAHGERRPDFSSLTRPTLDAPFDPDPALSQGLESDADEEVSAALQAVLDERQERQDRYRLTNDRDYYVLVCFQSEEQKIDFLEKSGWLRYGDRLIDGLKLARELGVDIEAINLPMREFTKPMPVNLRRQEVIE